MKIILNDMTNRVNCSCGILFEYDEDDIQCHETADYDYVSCPECDAEFGVLLDEKVLTVENIIFPDDFDRYDGVPIGDEQINEWIKDCLRKLKEDEEDFGTFRYTLSGDTFAIAIKHGDEYFITVARNYYSASIFR